MRAGILLLQTVPWPILRERVIRAEELGFDSIWVADHLVEPHNTDSLWSEAWTLLGAIAVTTTRATIGALTSSLTLRNPTLLVQAAQTLRDISGGRAELALGAGGSPLDHQMTGIPMWTPAERAARFAEFVPLVARMLREGTAPAGPSPRHFPLDAVHLPSSGGVRLTVGALGPRSIGLAARCGDAWNSYGVPAGKRVTDSLTHEQSLALFRERSSLFDRACAAAGRDPASITKSYTWVESYLGPMLSNLAGCRSTLQHFRDAGVTEFLVYWPNDPSFEPNLSGFVRLVHDL